MYLVSTKKKECPQCEGHFVRRSARKGLLERCIYRLFLLWPYRCEDCDVRFLSVHRS